MTRLDELQVGALYVPLLLVAGLAVLRRGQRSRFGAVLLGLLWAFPTLLVVQRLNQWAGWWSFAAERVTLRGMPLELLLGWAVLWGIVPQMAFQRLGIWWCAVVMLLVDVVVMPIMHPLVLLGPRWLLGEGVAVVLVLLPGLWIARWTSDRIHLRLRALVQVATAGLLFLYLVPEIAFAMRPGGLGWAPLAAMPSWELQAAVLMMLVLALPGVAAVMEFAQRGLGTPIPYDPPQRLVVSGVYRYCANPMQMSSAAVLAAWAGLLRNPWLLIPAAIAIVYSAGIAEWDEGVDLERRFGAAWVQYRREVRAWRWRLRPYAGNGAARLYVARTCGVCSEVGAWLLARRPLGLEFVDAETLPHGSIRRARYVAEDEILDGLRAMGRALEHLHLGWALCGAAMRLPGVWQALQMLMDACGGGPRDICGVAPQAVCAQASCDSLAITSISTSASRGSAATCTVERAGGTAPGGAKYLA